MTRARLRDLDIIIGTLPPGPNNAITDVPGVLVGHHTLIYDQPRVARTGVTAILPRQDIWTNNVFAAMHSFNGCGEMTGAHWVADFGLLAEPVAITNTHDVGTVHNGIIAYAVDQNTIADFGLPTVAETYDGFLNDINAFHVTQTHTHQALQAASDGPVAEGNVGGGTGMVCHEFKGGIGTASRQVQSKSGQFMVGALVQANYGLRPQLRVDGVPVGRELGADHTPLPWKKKRQDGSIIVIIATDAPLQAIQCKRLAQRATVGLARVGGVGHNGSGDIFLAFATGNHIPNPSDSLLDLKMLPNQHIDPFFEAAAEAVEEAILNALTAAETMTGYQGRKVHALPLDDLQQIMTKYRKGV